MRTSDRISLRNPAIGMDIIIPVGVALFVGLLIVRSATAAVAFGAAVVLFLLLVRSPLNALSLLLFLIPFSQTKLLNEPVAEFPGSRPFLLLGAFVAFIAFLNWRTVAKIPRLAMVYVVFFGGLLGISVVRALPNVDIIAAAVDQDYTQMGFLLSYLVKPALYMTPLVVIAKFARDLKSVNRLVDTLVVSLIALSVYFLFDYFFFVKDKGNIEAAWEAVSNDLGLWKGMAGFLYVIGFPMVIARYFAKKDLISLAGIILCLIAVGFLYSRTAYVTVVAAFFLFMFFSKRSKFLPVLLVLGVGASFIISDTIVQRATKGIETENLNQFTSGRVEHQWIPLLEEYAKGPVDFAFGRGRYSLVTTRVWESGILPGAMHPHNMFLEMILDAGLVTLGVVLIFILVLMRNAYNSLPYIEDRVSKEYQCGAFVSMICYLMGGMTTGTMFPSLENSYFWFVAGLSIVIARLAYEPKPMEQSTA